MTHIGIARNLAVASLAACLLAPIRPAQAGFTATVFATGAAVGGSRPDSITTDGSHVWVEYGNGASSTLPPGTGGSSTIAEYDLAGRVMQTYSIAGSADGLRYNPSTNQLWVLQNQDSNSALTTINASTGATAQFSYTSQTPGRGFDDVVFTGGKTYLSYTNPVNSADPIIVQATLGNGTISVSSVLPFNATGTNSATGQVGTIIANDPDSLRLRPDGSLVLSSGDDGALTTVRNPGTGAQAVSFLSLISSTGASLSGLDDTAFASSGDQRLLVADTANNTIYALQGSFQAGGTYGSIGSTNSVDFIDPTTGVSTSITDGLFAANASPHGLLFVPAAVPEPSSLTLMAIGALAGLGYRRFRTRASA